MERLNGETGASPVLLRNCKIIKNDQARSPTLQRLPQPRRKEVETRLSRVPPRISSLTFVAGKFILTAGHQTGETIPFREQNNLNLLEYS
jgi:hypothetical protein